MDPMLQRIQMVQMVQMPESVAPMCSGGQAQMTPMAWAVQMALAVGTGRDSTCDPAVSVAGQVNSRAASASGGRSFPR